MAAPFPSIKMRWLIGKFRLVRSFKLAYPLIMMNTFGLSRIFFPSDFSKGSQPAFAHALKLALDAKADLHILHAGPNDEEVHWSDFPHVRPMLERWRLIPEGSSRKAVHESGLRVEKIKKSGNDPVKAILQYLEEYSPDLVVLSTHQRQGLSRLLHRSIAEPIARGARTRTLFVPRRVMGFVSMETGRVRLDNVLIPVDKKPNPQKASDAAKELAGLLGAPQVHFSFFYAGEQTDMPEVDLPLQPGWTREYDAWKGNVVDHILAVGEDRNADLIVMSTAGHHGFLDALRGSTTERVLHGTRCPLLAVPS
jgi:nucleotide-binding universal stress UspA family protein